MFQPKSSCNPIMVSLGLTVLLENYLLLIDFVFKDMIFLKNYSFLTVFSEMWDISYMNILKVALMFSVIERGLEIR